MSATNTIATFDPIFPKNFLQQITGQVAEEVTKGLGMIAGAMWQIIKPYAPYAIGGLFVVLVFATVKAMFGKWGTLGSVLYHIFFFAILGIIVWIKGWGIFLSDYFDIIMAVLYRVCYWITGLILERVKNLFK
jgi:hypothetical protein